MFHPDQPGATWTRLGENLPHVQVFDLHYDYTDNVLVAGTLGRGAWTLTNPFGSSGAAPLVATVSAGVSSVSSGASASGSLDGMPLADLSFVFRSGGAAQPGDTGNAADSAGAAPLGLDSHHVDQLFAAIGHQNQGWMSPASKPHSFGLDEDWLTDVLVGLEL